MFISSIHFVHNHEGRGSSVMGLSVEDYLRGKEERCLDRGLVGVGV